MPQAVQPRKRSASTHPASFTDTALRHGLPASTLTDNGTVYTSRFTNGHNDFERLIVTLGITQKNGHPGHPQTQGKIERFHLQVILGRSRGAWLLRSQYRVPVFMEVRDYI